MLRRGLVLVAIAVSLLTLGAAGGFIGARLLDDGGPSDAKGPPCPEIAPEPVEPVVERFAPLVFVHPRERFRPLSAGCFLANAALYWGDVGGRIELAERGEVDPRRLGSGGYVVGDFDSDDHTRPFDRSRSRLPARTGFFVDVDDTYRVGAGARGPTIAGVPAYYELRDGQFVTYWFFFGFSAPGALLTGPGAKRLAHEGDWERISVRLNAENEPVEVAYYQHKRPQLVPWRDVPKVGTHPIVFSARGSHASYLRADVFRDDFDITRAGFLWWTPDLLVEVEHRPWYGFGGAWGVLGRLADTTGPLGPSRYKPPAPCAWLEGCPADG